MIYELFDIRLDRSSTRFSLFAKWNKNQVWLYIQLEFKISKTRFNSSSKKFWWTKLEFFKTQLSLARLPPIARN